MKFLLMKLVTLLFWVLCVTAFVKGWDGMLAWLPTVGLVVAGIHVLEMLFFLTAFRKKSTNVRLDALQILVFGIPHLQRFIPRA